MNKFKRFIAASLLAFGFAFSGSVSAQLSVDAATLTIGAGPASDLLAAGQDGSVGTPFDYGNLDTNQPSWYTLAVQISGSPGETFEHYANFTTTNATVATLAALNNSGSGSPFIDDFLVEVWDNTHPGGFNLIATFGGTNTVGSVLLNANSQYHLDISGTLGSGAGQGQYSVSLAVPEPEIYAMMAAGLGLMGFVARRRKRDGTVV